MVDTLRYKDWIDKAERDIKSAKVDDEFRKYLRDCGFLNQYYIETRYPSDTPLIVEDYEAEECISIAEDIYKLVMESIAKQ